MRSISTIRHMGQSNLCLLPVQQAAGRLHALGKQENKLNTLYETVRAQEPHGQALSPKQVRDICSVIESISLEDLGIDSALGQAMTYGMAGAARELRARLRVKGSRGTVTYLDIHDDPTMTIGIFQLPPGARMPLHDHPGMTVFSRLLYGTLHVRAYDWVNPAGDDCYTSSNASPASSEASSSSSTSSTSSNSSSHSSTTCELGCEARSSSIRPARLVTDRVLTAPADTMVLFPHSGGNIHAFTAISPCAILDVLTPPYGNRNCTYYRELFPPQWVDALGQPSLVPSEDIANWVAWQQAGQQQQQQQQQQQSNGVFGSLVPPSSPAAVAPVAGLHYPAAASHGIGQEDIVVGLEVWKEPADFRVARGSYSGRRVTACGH